jgi:hypothetical protein
MLGNSCNRLRGSSFRDKKSTFSLRIVVVNSGSKFTVCKPLQVVVKKSVISINTKIINRAVNLKVTWEHPSFAMSKNTQAISPLR